LHLLKDNTLTKYLKQFAELTLKSALTLTTLCAATLVNYSIHSEHQAILLTGFYRSTETAVSSSHYSIHMLQ